MPYCTKCGRELSPESRFCPNCGTPVVPTTTPQPAQSVPTTTTTLPPTPTLEKGVILADWGERFLAWLIDVLIVSAVSGLLNLPGIVLHPMIPFFTVGSRDVVQFLYWTILEGTMGQSLGKMAMRLRVTNIDGSQANLIQAAGESFGKAFLLPIDCIIGWLAEACKEKSQRLFNMLSKTIVIKVPREGA